jgi:hypothetical protein
MRWMSELSEQMAETEERCLLNSLSVLSDGQRNDLNVKQDIALNVVVASTALPTSPSNNLVKIQSTILLRNWHVGLSLCLRGRYLASAILTRAAIESLARITCQGETDATASAWFDDERVAFTSLLQRADPSGELLTQWRDLSEIAHSKTAAGDAAVGSGIILLGAQFDAVIFWKLIGALDSVLALFLRFARESFGSSLPLDPDTRRLLGQL